MISGIDPEINLARTLAAKYSLVPPVDVLSLARQYADVELLPIPFDVDGITLNLKIPGKKPHIIVNDSITSTRQRFTLAHEIGHILIPWHVGSIIDITGDQPFDPAQLDNYWITESEANRFASELLIPTNWLLELIREKEDPPHLVATVCDQARVSPTAATIKLINNMPPGYIYAQLTEGNVVASSGRSERTLANQPHWDSHIDVSSTFPFAEKMFRFTAGRNEYIWWKFPTWVDLPKSRDSREWREILDQIVGEIGVPANEAQKFKASVNGVIAFANSRIKGTPRTREAIYSACLQRFHSKTDLQEFVEHPSFTDFLVKRIWDLVTR